MHLFFGKHRLQSGDIKSCFLLKQILKTTKNQSKPLIIMDLTNKKLILKMTHLKSNIIYITAVLLKFLRNFLSKVGFMA